MSENKTPLRPRSVFMAVVLGTALGAFEGRAFGDGKPDPAVLRDIARYCQACWRNARLPADDWADCTQEVFARLTETVPGQHWGRLLDADTEERREFVRAIDAVKKRVQRRRPYSALTADAADRRPAGPDGRWELVEAAAGKVLSDRQRRILSMSRDGHTVPEIAADLGTTAERVSDEKYKAIRKLRRELNV